MQARQTIRVPTVRPAGTATTLGVAILIAASACAKKVSVVEFRRPPVTASVPDAPASPTAPAPSGDEEQKADSLPPEPTPEPAPRAPSTRAAAPKSRPDPPVAPPPPPPETSLNAELESLDPKTRDELTRADSLLSTVEARPLSSTQREQASSARAFVAQAKMAIRQGDERRALVLLGKGLLLVEDLEESSR